MNEKSNRPTQGKNERQHKDSDGRGELASNGFPAKFRMAHEQAPGGSDVDEIQRVAAEAHRRDVDPRVIWEEEVA